MRSPLRTPQFIFCLVLPLLVGCAQPPPIPPKTQLQIREFQTRTFTDRDARASLKSVIQALLDEGYLIRNADKDLGFINASKQEDLSNRNERLLNSLFMGERATWTTTATLECSVTVQEYGKDVRVRIVIQRQVFNNMGSAVLTETVDDPSYYQGIFSKVDKSLYFDSQRL